MVDEARRPTSVVERDNQVLVALVAGGRPLATLAEELQLGKNQVYGSLWRIRQRGWAQKIRVGSRTPEWHLTEEGVAQAQVVQATPPAPPEPAPEPLPV